MKEKINHIIQLLNKRYPNSKIALNFSNNWELLVATILSAQCTDKRVNIVTQNLFKKYKTIKDYANSKDLSEDIKSINFYKNKSKYIKESAILVLNNFKGDVPSNMSDLLSLPGVSRKTANVVLNNGFNKIEGIVVDTHVLRISKRLGLTENTNPVKVEIDLMNLVDKKYWGKISHLFISLGRDKCKAIKPICKECILRDICKYALENKTFSV